MSIPLSITHRPFGLDTPYQTLPDERQPRDPAGGDMVSIGFVTQPGRAAETVRICWERNGRPQTPIGVRPVALGTDEDRWIGELGVVEAGDTVEYWIEADGAGAHAQTTRERFTALRWRRAARFDSAAASTDGLQLRAVDAAGQPGPAISMTTVAGSVRITLQPAATTPAPGSEPDERLTLGHAHTLAVDTATATLRLERTVRATTTTLSTLKLRWLEGGEGQLVAVELVGQLADDEALVGFGERFDALDQRGRAPDAIVYEQYKNQGNRTYLPVPFFMSSAGYGCLIEGTAPVQFDLGRTIYDRWRCVADVPRQPGAGLTFDLFVGAPGAILRAFTALTGRPDAPPAWAFGLWMSSNEWNTQARVLRELANTQEHAIPATVAVIEAWSDETTFYTWNGAQAAPIDGGAAPRLADFTFPADGPWPDPRALVDTLHAAGVRLLLWQIPALKYIEDAHAQHDADVAYALAQGYVLRDGSGAPYRNSAFWFNRALIPDFTYEAASDWWMSKRAYLLDELGIDGFKTDGGEHLQGRGIQAHDGRRGDELVNAFPNHYIGAYYRFARERRAGDALTFSRAGYTGVGAFAAHWAGDENSTWEAYRRSIVAGLTAGLSGIVFWGWDIAGFSEALPGAELYLRATAMAAFCPIMQYHSEYTPPGAPSKDRTPWNVQANSGDTRVIPLFRFFANLRMNLVPYLVSEAAHAAATGEPMLRPLLLDDPDDPRSWSIADQYRLGRDLLVAPVVEEGATARRLYLPEGTWYRLWDAEAHTGGRWIEVAAPLDRIPVFARTGAILALNLGPDGVLGEPVGNSVDSYTSLSFWVFPGAARTQTWVAADGTPREIAVEPAGDGAVRITVPALPVACTVRLVGGQSQPLAASDVPQTLQLRLA